jgi:hypothetical protein
MEDLYLHIFSESSATIHAADVTDRVEIDVLAHGITYKLDKNTEESFWLLMLSNLVQFNVIINISKYFDVYKSVQPMLGKRAKI